MGFFDWFRKAASPPVDEGAAARASILAELGIADVAKADRKAPITEAPGVPGFSAYGGYLQTGERSADMTGTARWTLDANTKRNVAIVGAGLRRFSEFVGSPAWDVPPFDDTPESIERAAFAKKQIDNLGTPWSAIVQTAAMSRFDGAAIQVWAARRMPDGKIGLSDIVSRPMHTIERWDIDADGRLLGVWQRGTGTGEVFYIERGRMVFSPDIPITDSPAGVGIMRHIAESVRERGELRKMLFQGLETDLSGVPVMYAPIERLRKLINTTVGGKTYTEADFKRDISGVVDVANNPIRTKKSAMVLDSTPHPSLDGTASSGVRQFDVQLLSAGGRSHQVVHEVMRSTTWDIAIVLGVEYLLLGADGGGSLAMAQAKTLDFYRMIIGALRQFAQVAQRDILRPLWALNGWDPETAPRPTFDKLEFLDVVQVMTGLLPAIAAAGVPLDRRDLELVNAVLSHAGLPPLHEHEGDLMIDGPRAALAGRLGLDRAPNLDDAPDDTPGVDAKPSDGAGMEAP